MVRNISFSENFEDVLNEWSHKGYSIHFPQMFISIPFEKCPKTLSTFSYLMRKMQEAAAEHMQLSMKRWSVLANITSTSTTSISVKTFNLNILCYLKSLDFLQFFFIRNLAWFVHLVQPLHTLLKVLKKQYVCSWIFFKKLTEFE